MRSSRKIRLRKRRSRMTKRERRIKMRRIFGTGCFGRI
jgi:hypothetical protein